jgi:hypothetical protein
MNKNSNLKLTICLLLVLSAASCTWHRDKQSPISKKDSDNAEFEASSRGGVCPSQDSVRASITDLTALIDDALVILHDDDKLQAKTLSEELKVKITSLREKKDAWDEKNKALIAGCYLLLGADGTAVYPEIPAALDNLSQAGKWFGRSIDALATRRLQMADAYIQGTQFATAHASVVLDEGSGFDPSKAALKVPYYIKNADKLNGF